MWEKSFAVYLRNHLFEMKQRNSKISLRNFAKLAKISPGTMSELMSGKSRISARRAITILQNLGLPQSELAKWSAAMGEVPAVHSTLVSPSVYVELVDWRRRAILVANELFPKLTKNEMAASLKLSVKELETTLAVLRQIGLISEHQNGSISNSNWTTTDGPADKNIAAMHESDLQNAQEAISTIPASEREFSSLLVVGNRKQFEKLKKELKNFYKRAQVIMAEGEQNEVYQISMQAFPVIVNVKRGKL